MELWWTWRCAAKRALVTGGSRGIGRSIVRQLAQEGCHVAFCARGRQDLAATAAETRARRQRPSGRSRPDARGRSRPLRSRGSRGTGCRRPPRHERRRVLRRWIVGSRARALGKHAGAQSAARGRGGARGGAAHGGTRRRQHRPRLLHLRAKARPSAGAVWRGQSRADPSGTLVWRWSWRRSA